MASKALREYYHPEQRCYQLYYPEDARFMGIIALSSDASSKHRPMRTTKEVDADGEVDYFEPSTDREVNDWLKKIGEFAATHSLHPSQVQGHGREAKSCALIGFPKGYELYTHKKGPAHAPRVDHYLFGSKWIHVFRSPAEFFLHFQWLLADMPLDENERPDCACKYCSDVKQTEISTMYSHYKKRPHPSPTSPTEPTSKKEQKRAAATPPNGAAPKKQRKKEPKPVDKPILFKDYTKLPSTSQT